ncbi:hypothetical protein [Brevibacterium moorei]|uniref:hypothetical protein n=1 Tax=Brevibacterium moorei TaxID=2968457 RepID=UPI00211C2C80|nr:hypothetical protein [Brevibacterium sp. 68QC2CO]MCQ9384439.1 hypothetical protein [Brevibacterium sp. 68QC2CO]
MGGRTSLGGVARRLERRALLMEAERLLILKEAEAGQSFAGAKRALHPHEIRARVRFGEIDSTLKHAEAAVNAATKAAVDDVLAAVTEYLPDTVDTPQELQAALAGMLLAPPEAVKKALAGYAERLAGLLATVRERGRESVIGEAERQGVEVAAAMASRGMKKTPGWQQMQAAGTGVAGVLWQDVLKQLGTAAANPKKATVGDALEAAAGHAYKGVVDAARQETLVQHGSGRRDGVAEVQREPEDIWASELLDGSTCIPCDHIDGKDYASLDEAYVDYPVSGYKNCEGGNRCRGILVIDWGAEGRPEDPPEPEPKPEPEPAGNKQLRSVKFINDEEQFGRPNLATAEDAISSVVVGRNGWETILGGRRQTNKAGVPKFQNGDPGKPKWAGGHLRSSRAVGKTKFPEGWDSDKAEQALSQVLSSPGTVQDDGPSGWVLTGLAFGVFCRVQIGWNGVLSKFYPVYGPGVVRVGFDGKALPQEDASGSSLL